MLAHNAAIAGVPFDPYRLYASDHNYEVWLGAVVDQVLQTRRRQASEAR